MKNSDLFIDFYNKIDDYLKKLDKHDSHVTFTHKLKVTKNKVAKFYREDLISLGELRNAIVHTPRIGGEVIAEPHDETVRRIEGIYEKIVSPPKVIPTFQFPVLGAKEEEYINDIILEMKRKSFSQFPVFDVNGEVCELINNNTISRWLAGKLEENGTIVIENVKVKDFISEIEFKNNYKFVSKNTSIYEAYDLFINQINVKRRNLDVLFITETGKSKSKLLGLITIEDIANLI